MWLAGVLAALLAFLLFPYALHGFRFPLGPDAPVYLWWSRVGASLDLSLVERPGAPAIVIALSGALHLSTVATVAGLQCALGASVGAGAAALVRERGRAAWITAGLLSGLFAVHLATGYLANLVFAVAFLAAGVAVADGSFRGAVAAAAVFGGGGLAHPEFFLVGVGILLLVAIWDLFRRGERGWSTEAGRIAVAVGGGAALAAAGIVVLTLGPPHLVVDTSRDGFLRRAGLSATLRGVYADRFIHRWTRYVEWVSLPLALPGFRQIRGSFVGRLCGAWMLVVGAGVPLGLATGWFPADRLVIFGFAVPILAALGLKWLWERLRARPLIATAVTAVLILAMAVGSFLAYRRQFPFVSPTEASSIARASLVVDQLTQPGRPLVFIVDELDSEGSFLATRAANVLRAGLDPARASDIHVYVGTPRNFFAGRPTTRGNAEYDTLSRTYMEEIRSSGGTPLVMLLRPFDKVAGEPNDPHLHRWAPGVFVDQPLTAPEQTPRSIPLEPSSAEGIALASLALLAGLTVAGYGWARAGLGDRFAAIATAPAFGAAAITFATIAAQRFGISLQGRAGPTLASVLAGAGGYFAWLVRERSAASNPPP